MYLSQAQDLVTLHVFINQTVSHHLQASSWAAVENFLGKAGQNQSQNKAKLLKALQALRDTWSPYGWRNKLDLRKYPKENNRPLPALKLPKYVEDHWQTLKQLLFHSLWILDANKKTGRQVGRSLVSGSKALKVLSSFLLSQTRKVEQRSYIERLWQLLHSTKSKTFQRPVLGQFLAEFVPCYLSVLANNYKFPIQARNH